MVQEKTGYPHISFLQGLKVSKHKSLSVDSIDVTTKWLLWDCIVERYCKESWVDRPECRAKLFDIFDFFYATCYTYLIMNEVKKVNEVREVKEIKRKYNECFEKRNSRHEWNLGKTVGE